MVCANEAQKPDSFSLDLAPLDEEKFMFQSFKNYSFSLLALITFFVVRFIAEDILKP